ncbi:ParB/RepB/Spo0J family partition protein [Campylobacter sp. VBCF_06 NA8]|uniref:ParB/RepB/Spo0J family partition protein n=1 Tax=unclassified Campylobacter TaxID=2593542 RepID=UPI0022E9E7B1|nr:MULTISPECIES: ParB/RepB/Spo0J family partition protein [unclassified Campylobacter]MDA3043155.1 ParB/RepB/Spo0J family partition protein [Campylobacter sp. JMF_09 ED2]MDA3044807.1 ParB/RepB/Spo0J family partition protein [Campylobacter sp. JMF_07 ED4]MDA3045928.1 ParB/RepB/Spo0J family partition protein [Campylobacter sp. VBCF_06 NA8]MDA3057469.1 ParB/RepB/Spo0J family partition protein [Campylobacter sp. VBCF_04 NA7]MDA3058959.1 ParB/RepB/Spo0J family partition protein [Campylobacter sp. V
MSKVKKSVLGRGLGSILEDVEKAYTKELEDGQSENLVIEIDVDKISPNPYQPRLNFNEEALRELSESILRHGLIQPIVVIEKNGAYVLIAGERRLRATKLAGLGKIKAVVADLGSQNMRELALIENIQRENLNPIELAKSYRELIEEYKITQEELADIIKKSRTQITNTMRLLNLSAPLQDALRTEKISQGHAKVIVGLSEDEQILVLNTITGQKLSVRETEDLIKKLKSKENVKTANNHKEFQTFKPELMKLKEKLNKFGKISVKDKKILIEFSEISQISDFMKQIG